MALGIIPAPERVLIEIDPGNTTTQTKSGIYVASPEHIGAPTKGVVAAIGSRITNKDFKVGETVYFDEPKPHGFKWEGKSYLSLKEFQIVAVER